MLGEACPTCNIPLMRSHDMQTICLGCDRVYDGEEQNTSLVFSIEYTL